MLKSVSRSAAGLLAALVLALAASGLARTVGGSPVLYALLLGMLLHPWARRLEWLKPGVNLAADPLLKLGVVLLGVEITLQQILSLGIWPLVFVVVAIPLTIALGLLVATRSGQGRRRGFLTGGAVAICGASAAMALASLLPNDERTRRDLALAVLAVAGLGTAAMLVYPALAELLHLSARQAGVFLGGSIHNVPQAVGAGYMVSADAGSVATFVKLLRVAMLVPVMLGLTLWQNRRGRSTDNARRPLLPAFLVGFILVATANSLGWIPASAQEVTARTAHVLLTIAIAALGLKTAFLEILALGWRPLMLVAVESLWIAGLALGTALLMH